MYDIIQRLKAIFQSTLAQYLLSFFTVVSIPLIMYTGASISAKELLTQEINISNSSYLQQFSYQMDGIFSTAQTAINTISTNTTILSTYNAELEDDNSSVGQQYEAYVVLQNYTDTFCYDILLYLSESDRVVSQSKGTGDPYIIYSAAYNKLSANNSNFDTWYYALSMVESSVALITLESDTDSYFAMQSYIPAQAFGKTLITATYIFDKDAITQQFSDTRLMIFTPDHEILFSTDETLELSDDFYHGETDFFTASISGEDYMIKVTPSSIANCYYACFIPTSVFDAKLIEYSTTQYLTLAISIFFSLFLSYLLARRTYKPIKEIISTLSDTHTTPATAKNELSYISQSVDVLVRTKEQLTKQLEESSQKTKLNVLWKLLHAQYNDDSVFDELDNANFIYRDKKFFVFIISFSDSVSCETLLQQNFPAGFIAPCNLHEYVCIYTVVPDTTSQELADFCDTVRHKLEQALNLHCAISISTIANNIWGISLSYQEAKFALRYKSYYGDQCVLSYQTLIQTEITRFSFEMKDQIKNLLIYAINHPDTMKTTIQSITSSYFENTNKGPEHVTLFIYHTTDILYELLTEFSLSFLRKDLRALVRSQSLASFLRDLEPLLQTIAQNKKQPTTDMHYLIKSVCTYVQEHYAEDSLDINELGHIFSLTPSYLSKLFKAEAGEALSNYILRTRIDAAKKLLRETNESIQNIATRSGFNSSSTFIKSFRKACNTTPGVYRENNKANATDIPDPSTSL